MNNLIKVANTYLGIDTHKRKQMIDFYNNHCMHLVDPTKRHYMSMGESWCGMFVSVVARHVGLGKNEFPYGVSVYEQMKKAKDWGVFHSGLVGASEGDLIIFDWNSDGHPQHIGFISKLSTDLVVTIEGNYSNTVQERYFKPSAKYVLGHIRLGGVYNVSPKARIEDLAERVLLGEFGNGSERADALGSDYRAVQSIVNRMMK